MAAIPNIATRTTGTLVTDTIWNEIVNELNSACAILNKDTSVATFTNSGAENSLYSTSVAANRMSTTRVLKFESWLSIVTDGGGARNVNFRVKFGGTTMLTGNVGTFGAGTTHYLKMTVLVFESGATNSQRAIGMILAANSGAGNSWNALGSMSAIAGGSATVDTTSNQTFEVTAQMDSAQVGFSVNMQNGALTLE